MDSSVDKKLKALLKLQDIDSKKDAILKIRGDLPEEVQDLEDDIAGFETRINKFQEEVNSLNKEIDSYKVAIKDSENLITKYGEQQMKVRNNREYDAITKEIELQQLEAQISEKKIKEAGATIKFKEEEIAKTEEAKSERLLDLDVKKEELKNIVGESTDEEDKLEADRAKAANKIEERLLNSYNKIRKNARNGLAVVIVKRDACGGCFNTVPPQRQADIKDRKKLIVCEHCGRILADVEIVIEEEAPKKKRTTRKKAAAK